MKTPLHCAADWGTADVARALLEGGANLEAVCKARQLLQKTASDAQPAPILAKQTTVVALRRRTAEERRCTRRRGSVA